MIRVRFLGGARKSFSTESLEIDRSDMPLDELLSVLLQSKPESTPALDIENILVAVNGIDSSALQGSATILKDNDTVSIIPIIHGGSPKHLWLCIMRRQFLIVEIPGRQSDGTGTLDSLRRDFPNVRLQAVSSRFILGKYHLEKIISLSVNSERKKVLLSNKLETDLLMRFAVSGQISTSIKTVGIKPGQNFVLVATGNRRNLDSFFRNMPYQTVPVFARDNSAFLKRHFHLTQRHLDAARSKNPLADVLVEKAATLF